MDHGTGYTFTGYEHRRTATGTIWKVEAPTTIQAMRALPGLMGIGNTLGCVVLIWLRAGTPTVKCDGVWLALNTDGTWGRYREDRDQCEHCAAFAGPVTKAINAAIEARATAST